MQMEASTTCLSARTDKHLCWMVAFQHGSDLTVLKYHLLHCVKGTSYHCSCIIKLHYSPWSNDICIDLQLSTVCCSSRQAEDNHAGALSHLMFFPSTLANHLYNAHTSQHNLTSLVDFFFYLYFSFFLLAEILERSMRLLCRVLLNSPASCCGGIQQETLRNPKNSQISAHTAVLPCLCNREG